jgi:4-azaleucine resistance transporter AzlC
MIKKGFKDAIPIMIGYFPIAITFGILADSVAIEVIDGVMMSAFVFAGASQFMAVSMVSAGIGINSIITATLFVNFRHFIMSSAIKSKMSSINKKYFPMIGFLLTDETFSVISLKDNIKSEKYLLTFQLCAYFSWVIGTLVGYLAGMFFPAILVNSLGIALYALFISLIVPSFKKSKKIIILTIASGFVNTVFQKVLLLNEY